MKKLSVSLLALIAIVFAVTTAFSTAPETVKASTSYFANQNKVDPPVYNLDVTSAVAAMPGPSQAEKEQQFRQAHCPSDETVICFARFEDGDIDATFLGLYQ